MIVVSMIRFLHDKTETLHVITRQMVFLWEIESSIEKNKIYLELNWMLQVYVVQFATTRVIQYVNI